MNFAGNGLFSRSNCWMKSAATLIPVTEPVVLATWPTWNTWITASKKFFDCTRACRFSRDPFPKKFVSVSFVSQWRVQQNGEWMKLWVKAFNWKFHFQFFDVLYKLCFGMIGPIEQCSVSLKKCQKEIWLNFYKIPKKKTKIKKKPVRCCLVLYRGEITNLADFWIWRIESMFLGVMHNFSGSCLVDKTCVDKRLNAWSDRFYCINVGWSLKSV